MINQNEIEFLNIFRTLNDRNQLEVIGVMENRLLDQVKQQHLQHKENFRLVDSNDMLFREGEGAERSGVSSRDNMLY